MGLTQLNFAPNLGSPEVLIDKAGRNKVEMAIMRLREFEPLSLGQGFYFADSYGKDSCATRRLLQMAGSKYDGHYSRGGIDPPELVVFGRENHPEVIIDKPAMSIWKKLMTQGLPTRQARWCCDLIKEQHGSGRIVVTGIRWLESSRRANRRMFEVCQHDKTKYFLHPLIDWTDDEVWDFINSENIPYCSLYDVMYWNPYKKKMDRRFGRLGCVLCPMKTSNKTKIDLEYFPKIADVWKRAAHRYYDLGNHKCNEEYDEFEKWWQWWLSRKGEPKVNEAQCIMFDN